MPMIAATAATRATTAAPPVKGAPTLAGGDFALAIAGLFGGAEDIPGGPEVAAGITDKLDGDRQDDADGGTTLPGSAPPLDPALAWLPFAPVDAPVTVAVTVAVTVVATVVVPGVTVDRTTTDAPPTPLATARVAMTSSPTIDLAPPVVDIAAPDRTIAAVPIPSTTASAIATSSLTPVPVVVPRADPAPTAPSGAADPVQPSVHPAIAGAVSPPPSGMIDASSMVGAAGPTASAGNAPPVAARVNDPFATAAMAAASGTTVAAAPGEPATVAVPTRFRASSPAVAAVATPAPATTDPIAVSPMAIPADRPPATMPVSAVAIMGAQPIATPSAASPGTTSRMAAPVVVPPLPTADPLRATVSPAADSVGISPATADTIIVAAAAPVPVAPAAFLRQIVADASTPAAPLAVVVPDAVAASPGLVFGAAIRATASASDDKPALAATDPLAPVATPVAEVRTITATTSAQQAPLDMSQPRWPHAMVERIDQLRDAINAVDTRIRLIPDALGQIDVSIRQDSDTTHVTFAAEQAATRTMLQDAAPRLTAIAEERGLKLGQSTTDTGQQPPSQQRQAAQQNATNRAPVSTHADRDTATDDGDGRVA